MEISTPDSDFGRLVEPDTQEDDLTQQLPDWNKATQEQQQMSEIIPFVANPQNRDQLNDSHMDLPPIPITDDMIETIPFDNRGAGYRRHTQ